MPGASYGLRGAFVNGKFYAISGFATNRIGIYDPANNSWTTGAPLPQFPPDTGYNLRQYFGCAVVGTKIYVIGGDTGGSGARDTNYIYDTATDSWTSGAPMPLGSRYGIVAVNLNGMIYVIGGVDSNGTYLSRVEIYNPASDAWTTGPDLPANLQGIVAEAIGGKIYVAGGSAGGNSGPNVNGFVFDGSSWSPISSMPIAGNGGSAVVNGKMFVVGCGSNGAPSATAVQSYDPNTNTWDTNYPPLPLGRGDGAVASDPANGIIYDAGGYNGVNGGFLDELDILPIGSGAPVITNPIDLDYLSTNEIYDPMSAVWTTRAQMPTARQAFGLAVASGGQDGTWTSGPDISGQAAYAIQAVGLNGKIYAISGFSFGGNDDTRIYDPATNNWSLGAAMPGDTTCSQFQQNGFCYTLRQFAGCAGLNGKVYVIGGDTGGTGDEAANLIYNTAADTWSNGAILPGGPRHDLAAVALNGKIYVIGGDDDNNNYYSRVDVYDPSSNTWAPSGTARDLPAPRAGMASGVINGKIYIAGGRDDTGAPLTTGLVYDPATNAWSPHIAAMPLQGPSYSAVLSGKLFIVGAAGSQNLIESYDPSTDTWSTSYPPMLTARGAVAAAADEVSQTLYTIGGDNGPFAILSTFEILSFATSSQKIYAGGGQVVDNVCSPIATLEAYNPTTNTWASLSPMPTARSDVIAASVNNVIYFIGGNTCAGAVPTVEAYDPSAKKWTPRQSMNVPRYGAGSAVLDNKIYVFGGYDSNGSPLSALEVYDPTADQWMSLQSMTAPRSLLVGEALNNLIYAIGGQTSSDPNNPSPTSKVESYDPGSNSWTSHTDMPTPRYASGGAVSNGMIDVFGGQVVDVSGGQSITHEVSTHEIYDPVADAWSVAPPLPTARFGLGGALLNNQVYGIGGRLKGIAKVGQLFVYQITATNNPTSFGKTTPLPDGLQLDGNTGIISGIPTSPSADNLITVTATANGMTGSANLIFSIEPADSDSAPAIISSQSATGVVNQQFGQPGTNGTGFQVRAINFPSPTYAAGGLPPGLQIDPNTGLISGTPTLAGNFQVSVSVFNTSAKITLNSILQLTIVADSGVPLITSSDNITLQNGQQVNYKITASTGATFDVKGPLPNGLMFDGVDTISGTYTGTASSKNTAPNRFVTKNSLIGPRTLTIRPRQICQLVANNGSGTGTAPLNFLEPTLTFSFDPPDITREADGPDGVVVSFAVPAAQDAGGNNVPVSCDAVSGATFPIGTTVVSCTASNDPNDSASFKITVTDTTPPVITTPGTVSVVQPKRSRRGPAAGVTVTYAACATDIVDGSVANVTFSPPSGSLFTASGPVTVTATDAHGNVQTAQFNVSLVKKLPKAPRKHPTVNISVSSPSVSEGGSVTFTAQATGVINRANETVVGYVMSGDASQGSDFTLTGGCPQELIIPANSTTGQVTFMARQTSSSSSKMATMTIQGGSGYTVSTGSATVTINSP